MYMYTCIHIYICWCTHICIHVYIWKEQTHTYTHTHVTDLNCSSILCYSISAHKNPCTFCEGKKTRWLCRLKSLGGSIPNSLQTQMWIIWWYPICLKRVCCRRYLLPSSAALASYKGVEVGLWFFAQYCAIFAASLLSLHTAFSSNLEALVEPHSHSQKV